VWDRFYHVVLLSDRNLRALLAELGLADRLQWGTTRTGFYTDGELHSLSSSLEFLTFPPLGIVDKVRLALTILYASRVTDYRRLEGIAVADWLGRLGGRAPRAYLAPLLRSKLGENYRLASASFIWPRSRASTERVGRAQARDVRVRRRWLRHRAHAASRAPPRAGVEVVCGVPVAEVRETAPARSCGSPRSDARLRRRRGHGAVPASRRSARS
jgi:protoporphyrinogen oxidase